jgi:SAM-dependent methyltransferase
MRLFDESAPYYDALYDAIGKDYEAESGRLRQLIRRHKKSKGKDLLDVACGTGRHISFLKSSFDAEGLDLDRNLLAIARRRNKGVRFYHGDMRTFKLAKRFDVITCLFSAIGHMTTNTRLRSAIRNMSLHLKPGGVLIVEPWITPANFKRSTLEGVLVKEPKLTVARIGKSTARGRISILEFWYIAATPERTKYFKETVKFGLFTHAEYLAAFRSAGLKVVYYSKGLIGRGLCVGIK